MKDIDISKATVFPKTKFSMIIPEVEKIIEAESNRKNIVLFGIEVTKIFSLYKYQSFVFNIIDTSMCTANMS